MVCFAQHFREVYRTDLNMSDFPLYPLLLKAALWVLPATEAGVRAVSALAGIAQVAVLYALGRRLAGERLGAHAGLWTMLLAVFAPFLIYYSQECRIYSVYYLLALVALWLQVGEERLRERWWWLSAVWGLMLLSHIVAWFVVAGQFALLWLLSPGERRRGVYALGTALLVLSPVLYEVIGDFLALNAQSELWYQRYSLKATLHSLVHWLYGYGFERNWSYGTLPLWLGVMGFGLWKMPRRRETWLALGTLTLPYAALVVVSVLGKNSGYISRVVGYHTGLLLVLAGIGLAALPEVLPAGRRARSVLPVVAGVALLATLVPSLVNHYANRMPHSFGYHPGVFTRREHRLAGEYLLRHHQPGESLLHSCRASLLPIRMFYAPHLQGRSYLVGATPEALEDERAGNPVTAAQVADFLPEIVMTRLEDALVGQQRVWVIYSVWEEVSWHPAWRNTEQVREAMSTWGRMLRRERFVGLDLALYERYEVSPDE